MYELAFVVVQASDVRPLPLVECTGACDKDICDIFEGGIGAEVFDCDMPFRGSRIPTGFHTLVAELHVLLHIVFVGHTLPVF